MVTEYGGQHNSILPHQIISFIIRYNDHVNHSARYEWGKFTAVRDFWERGIKIWPNLYNPSIFIIRWAACSIQKKMPISSIHAE